MGLKNPVVKLAWGKLIITKMEVLPHEWFDPKGISTIEMEEHVTMACSCGGELVMWAQDIDKRIHKDCGNCPTSEETGQGLVQSGAHQPRRRGRRPNPGGRHVVQSFYMPINLLTKIDVMAQKRDMTLSAVAVELIETGIASIEQAEERESFN